MRRVWDQGRDAGARDIYQEGRSQRVQEGKASDSFWLQVSLVRADI